MRLLRWPRSSLAQLAHWVSWASSGSGRSLTGVVTRDGQQEPPSDRWLPDAWWLDLLTEALALVGLHPNRLPAEHHGPYIPDLRNRLRLWDIWPSTYPRSQGTGPPDPPPEGRLRWDAP